MKRSRLASPPHRPPAQLGQLTQDLADWAERQPPKEWVLVDHEQLPGLTFFTGRVSPTAKALDRKRQPTWQTLASVDAKRFLASLYEEVVKHPQLARDASIDEALAPLLRLTHTDIGQGIRAEALARCMKSLSCVLKQQAHPLPTSLEVDLQEPLPRLTPRPPLEQVLERRPPAASLSLQDLLKECLGKPDAETTVEPAQLEAIAARLDGYLCDPGERLDLGDIGIDALDEFVCMGLWRCFTEHLGTATPRGPSHIVMPAGVEGPPACLDAKALPRLSVLELPDFGGDSLDLLHLPSLSLVVFSGEAPEFEKDQLRLPSGCKLVWPQQTAAV